MPDPRPENEPNPLTHHVRVVLVGTQEPMNVGAVARAMRNFGMSELWLVSPEPRVLADLEARPNSNAYRLAVHAEAILDGLRRAETVLEAVRDCQLVLATTARFRDIHVGRLVEPRGAAQAVAQVVQRGKVALLFGRETYGLTNEEMDQAGLIVRIPTAPEQPSLNLAQAVLLLAYEVFVAISNPPAPSPERLAEREALERLFEDLENYILQIGFTDSKRFGYARRRLRRILHKAELTPAEVQMLRGLLHQSRWYAKNGPR
jgi:tRNA/rRNA methyltransferase